MKQRWALYIYLGIATWVGIVLLILVCSFPVLPISVPTHFRSKVIGLVPQGWGFFTRNPREEYRDAYYVSNTTLVPIHNQVFSIRGKFGLNRDQRIIFSEIGTLAGQVPDSCWITCKGKIENIVNLKYASTRINNSFSVQNVTGTIYLVKHDVIPWAWIKTVRDNDVELSFKVAKINVI